MASTPSGPVAPVETAEPEDPAEPVAGTIDAERAAAGAATAATAASRRASTTEPAADTGRHAIVRPAPTPPDEPSTAAAAPVETPPDPVRTAAPTSPTTPEPAADPRERPPATALRRRRPSPPRCPPEPVTPAPVAEDDDRLFPDPNAPRSTSVGSHILGFIVGLILAPISVVVLLLGESRILEAQVNGWDASTEVVGVVLVSLGVLLLGCVLLLALWTPAVPITGGTLLTLAGIVYLYLPSFAREQTLNVLTSSSWRLTVTQVTVAGTSGMVLVVGFLLLLAGIVAASPAAAEPASASSASATASDPRRSM